MATIHEMDIIEFLKGYKGDKFHAVLSDPPYGLSFMGKSWDKYTPKQYQKWVTEWGELLLNHLHDGAVCMFFGGTRTYHRLATGLEDAGFEIFDSMIWCYGSGFPKSHNISKAIDKSMGLEREIESTKQSNSGGFGHIMKTNKEHGYRPNDYYEQTGNIIIKDKPNHQQAQQWNGYGTALKPAYEPIVLCRKPRTSTYANMALENGSGALNIDGGRIETKDNLNSGGYTTSVGEGWDRPYRHNSDRKRDLKQKKNERVALAENLGRFPANFGLICECEKEPCECIESELDNQSGVSKSSGGKTTHQFRSTSNLFSQGSSSAFETKDNPGLGDKGGASRFFYTAKASRKERNAGLDILENKYSATMGNGIGNREHNENEPNAYVKNNHPTVKPLKLTEYLAKLLLPPIENSRILIPFSGSGSEMIGAGLAGWPDITGIELNPDYIEIAEKRLEHWLVQKDLV